MKLARFTYNQKIYWGKVSHDNKYLYTNPKEVQELNTFEEVIRYFSSSNMIENNKSEDTLWEMKVPIADIQWEVPVLPTKNILCIGKNYVEHILEFEGRSEVDVDAVKEAPVFFTKALSSLLPAEGMINPHIGLTNALDYEAELAVVIGKKGSNISLEEAYDYIYGYSILNDVTARDLQNKHQQWFKGKGLDTFCPIGPWIVTKDEISNPQALDIRSYVDGELRQNSNTKHMIYKIADLIVWLSKGMTLYPGDVIATGTPKGVGMGYKPKRFMTPGTTVEIEIEGIGRLKNFVKKY